MLLWKVYILLIWVQVLVCYYDPFPKLRRGILFRKLANLYNKSVKDSNLKPRTNNVSTKQENNKSTRDIKLKSIEKFLNSPSNSKEVALFQNVEYDANEEEGWYEEDVGYGLTTTSQILGAAAGMCAMFPNPVTVVAGAILGTLSGAFSWIGNIFNREAAEKQKKVEERFKAALAKTEEERRELAAKANVLAKENEFVLQEIKKDHVQLVDKFGVMNKKIQNITARLTNELQEAEKKMSGGINILKYKDKRYALESVEDAARKLIPEEKMTFVEKLKRINRKDLVEKCEKNKPLNILHWIHNRVMSGERKTSLLSAILDYVQHDYVAFQDWKRIILGDSVKAMLYQEICHQIDVDIVPDFVRKEDRKNAFKMVKQIEHRVLYFEEKALHIALYHEYKGLQEQIMKHMKDRRECKEKNFGVSAIAQSITEFLKTNFDIGPWVAVVREKYDNGNDDVYRHDGVYDPTKKFGCQHHVDIKNVCLSDSYDVTAVVHAMRFHGAFQLKYLDEIKKNLTEKTPGKDPQDMFDYFKKMMDAQTITFNNMTEYEWTMSKVNRKDKAKDWLSSQSTLTYSYLKNQECTYTLMVNRANLQMGFYADELYFIHEVNDVQFVHGISTMSILGVKEVQDWWKSRPGFVETFDDDEEDDE